MTMAQQLMRQIGGGELSDFLSEDERTERSDLKPLGSAGRGITYPGTEDVPGVLTDALANLGTPFFTISSLKKDLKKLLPVIAVGGVIVWLWFRQ